MHLLNDSVRPAFSNDFFKTRVYEISERWCNDVLSELCTHYEDQIAAAAHEISTKPLPKNLLEVSLNLVRKWARTQLGNRLPDSTLDEAFSLILSKQQLVPEHTEPSSAAPLPVDAGVLCSRFRSIGVQASGDPPVPVTTSVPTPGVGVDVSLQTSEPTASNIPHLQVSPSLPVPRPRKRRSSRTSSSPDVDLDRSSSTTLSGDQDGAKEEPNAVPVPPPSSEDCLTQLDLFGSPVESEKPIDSSFPSPIVILGDDNVQRLKMENATSFGPANGRLSHLKKLLYGSQGSYPNVEKFILCLSLLDKTNLPSTNLTTCKSLIYHAHKIFPNASFHIVPLGVPERASHTVVNNIDSFNALLANRKPSFCNLVDIPSDCVVKSKNHLWDSNFCEFVIKKLHFLF